MYDVVLGPPFEWDENKRRVNIEKHGIDFVDAVNIFQDSAMFSYLSSHPTHETRHVSVGRVGNRLIAVISTQRGSNLRIISARMARQTERDRYGGI
jgi:uncharacterized DUF497 family protein